MNRSKEVASRATMICRRCTSMRAIWSGTKKKKNEKLKLRDEHRRRGFIHPHYDRIAATKRPEFTFPLYLYSGLLLKKTSLSIDNKKTSGTKALTHIKHQSMKHRKGGDKGYQRCIFHVHKKRLFLCRLNLPTTKNKPWIEVDPWRKFGVYISVGNINSLMIEGGCYWVFSRTMNWNENEHHDAEFAPLDNACWQGHRQCCSITVQAWVKGISFSYFVFYISLLLLVVWLFSNLEINSNTQTVPIYHRQYAI